MTENPKIPGGYLLIARKMFDGELMDKPPHYLKLWLWLLYKANWKDRDKLKRSQLVATIEEMREAMSYKVGYSPMQSKPIAMSGFMTLTEIPLLIKLSIS